MIISTTVCDMCGAKRGETNHWYIATLGSPGIVIYRYDKEKEPDWTHLCGESCVLKFISENLNKLHK